jgi:hypothetical protein
MNLVYGVQQVMHRIRVKLYHNYFPKGGPYIARTDSEATLNIDQIGAARRDRGGLTMDFEDFIDGVKQFFEEMIYQLCDGFAVNTGYFTIYPNLGGTFKSVHETPDPKTHPLTFRFHARKPLRDIAAGIHIVVEGLADVEGWIDEYRDTDEDAVNSIFIPGDQFVINGHKIKIAGDDPVVGLFFVPVDNPSAAVKVTRLAENSSSRIIGIAPQTGHQYNRIEVRTQYSHSGSPFLKNPRVITSDFILEEA